MSDVEIIKQAIKDCAEKEYWHAVKHLAIAMINYQEECE